MLSADYDLRRATETTAKFREFLEANKDELTALQVLFPALCGAAAHLSGGARVGRRARPSALAAVAAGDLDRLPAARSGAGAGRLAGAAVNRSGHACALCLGAGGDAWSRSAWAWSSARTRPSAHPALAHQRRGPRMNPEHVALVGKVWNYAHVLRDQGVRYGDYVEQITFLLFLKMDEERAQLLGEPSIDPGASGAGTSWGPRRRDARMHYRHTLEELASERPHRHHLPKAQSKINDPAKLKRLVAHRRRDLDRHRRRREGRDLRGPAGTQRRRGEARRGPVLHAAPADRGDGGGGRSRSPARRCATRPAAPAGSCSRPTST